MLGSNEHWTFHSKETNVNTSEKNERSIVTINLEVKKRLNIDSNLVTLKPGKYVFDFRFQIPIEIEPSFEYPYSEGKTYLRYFLSSQIISPQIKGTSNIFIILKKPLKFEKDKQISYNVETSTHKLGLFDIGTIKMEIKSIDNTDHFKIGGDIKFKINIDNSKGKLKPTECKIVLKRTVIFKARLSQTKNHIKNKLISFKIKVENNPGEQKSFVANLNLNQIDNKALNVIASEGPYNINNINDFISSIK